MTFHSQGSRPNYQSTIQPLSYNKGPSYTVAKHEQFIGGAVLDLSVITELDFEQPRVLWERVYDDAAKERFVQNVAGHLGGAKSAEVKARTLSVLCVSFLSALGSRC